MTQWVPIPEFPDYSVSDDGDIRNDQTDRLLRPSLNQQRILHVGLMKNGVQHHRSIALLVASAFLEKPNPLFNTPINLDGDPYNCSLWNLTWRPRWFAIKYKQQFRDPQLGANRIHQRIENIDTGYVSHGSLECCMYYGILESDLILSIHNNTYVWPLYEQFRVLPD